METKTARIATLVSDKIAIKPHKTKKVTLKLKATSHHEDTRPVNSTLSNTATTFMEQKL